MAEAAASTDEANGIYLRGQNVRRNVLGDDYVDNSLRHKNDFNESLQELVVKYCWGEVWAREGLDRRTRSLINIAILTAINRSHELRTHVRGAVNNGCTEEEISEVILQSAIYCGVPAAIDASRTAGEVLQEIAEASRLQAEATTQAATAT